MPATSNPRVMVSGQPVVTLADVETITGCPFVSGTVYTPCVTGQWVTAATRVLAGGVPVVLQDSQAVCVPTGTGLSIVATQVRVKGM